MLDVSSKTPDSARIPLPAPSRTHIWPFANHASALTLDIAVVCLSSLEGKLPPASLRFCSRLFQKSSEASPFLITAQQLLWASLIFRGWGRTCHYSAVVEAHLIHPPPDGRILYFVLQKSETMQRREFVRVWNVSPEFKKQNKGPPNRNRTANVTLCKTNMQCFGKSWMLFLYWHKKPATEDNRDP